jgi:uncharacterized protein (UPF0335 family)
MSSQSLDSSDKSLLLNAFITQLTEFIEDIELVFNEDSAIKKAKTSIFMIKKVNPTLTAKIWYNYICSKYESEINNDNIDFFLQKDYKKDLVYMNQSEQIISSIDKLRDPIKNMSKENQEKSLKYIKNLCILSKLYMQ